MARDRDLFKLVCMLLHHCHLRTQAQNRVIPETWEACSYTGCKEDDCPPAAFCCMPELSGIGFIRGILSLAVRYDKMLRMVSEKKKKKHMTLKRR